jgi:hypothetical protein
MQENRPGPGEEPGSARLPGPADAPGPGSEAWAGPAPEAGAAQAPEAGAAQAPEAGIAPAPEVLLGELARLRRRTRSARHAYWLPLVLYGVLICLAAPLYVQSAPSYRPGVFAPPGPQVQVAGLGGEADGYIAIYWLFALAAGFWLTALWYRRRGRRAGLLTSARGFIIVGVVVTSAVILLSVVPPAAQLWPGDLVFRGTFPLFIVAIGLMALAWAERSWALVVTAVVFTGAAFLANLYDVENILFRLGWNPGLAQLDLTVLPNTLLPAAVLLVAGLCAFPAQRPRRLAAQ